MKKLALNVLFAILMTAMTLCLATGVVLTCAVRMLEPRHLTPLVEHFANKALDAEVSLGRAELSFSPAFPFLHLDLDSLLVLSKAFDTLPAGEREALPSYADTLFVLDKFHGGINLGALLGRGEIALDNVELCRPELNIVISSSAIGNFDIYHPADTATAEADGTPADIPPFSIGRFSFVEPREIRYFNAADSTEASIVLLSEAFVDGSANPLYKLKVDGRFNSPVTKTFVNLDEISFGLDGHVRWEPKRPEMVALEDFSVSASFFNASLSLALDFDSVLTVNSARLGISPVPVDSLLTLLPDDIRHKWHLTRPVFDTDASIVVEAMQKKPFSPGADSIPYADIDISIPDSRMSYGKATLHKLALDATVNLRGNNPDDASIDIRRFTIAGPATELDMKAHLTDMLSDPAFDASVTGRMNIRNLPPVAADYVRGFLDGRLDMELTARGRSSMFSQEHFHKLDINGRLSGNKLYYLSNDTANMVAINHAVFGFDSQHETKPDSMGHRQAALGAKITVDTASILLGGVGINVGNLTLGAGVENAKHRDTTAVIPIGGGIKIARLNIQSITDSAGVRIRGLGGKVSLQRYKGDRHNPSIHTDFRVERLAAGTKTSRILLSQAVVKAETHKRELSPDRKAIKHLADSIRQCHPELPPDSVYAMAIRKRHHPGRHHHRVHDVMTEDDLEVIDWGISSGLRRYLTGWTLDATIGTTQARVFTPYFPLRNHIDMLDIAVSTDSVELRGVRYTAGTSNLTAKGLISNIRRALTAKRPSPLKINLEVNSDTIDINRIAEAIFAGSAYAERMRRGEADGLAFNDDDNNLDLAVEALTSEKPDTVSPLLIPSNIDGTINVKAGNVLYSDLVLNDFTGQILVYDGAVNLHGLHAASVMGAVDLSALYSAPKATDIRCGMSLGLKRFNVERFLRLVPAIDSIMPLMRDVSGIINADIAATVDIDSAMNVMLPTLDAAINLSGDSLTIIDPDTYRTLGKWLRFRNKADNVIKHMNVELIVRDNRMQIFPFVFNIDRYRLGVLGSNDLNMNFNYHISVLKSPLPFKFGITIKGNPDKYKVRFGGARFKEGMVAETVNVVDTARVNLLQQIEGVFRRGVQNSRFSRLNVGVTPDVSDFEGPDNEFTPTDSLLLRQEGILPEVPAQEENK